MVKSELAANISHRTGVAILKAEEIIDLFFDAIEDSMCRGERVEIRGFGSFMVREYKAYEGRNPKNGGVVHVLAKRLPFWKTGNGLGQRVDSKF